MRVRLHSDEFKLTGYANYKITSKADLEALSVFDRGELDELVVDHVLEYLPAHEVEDVISSLSKLIKVGGTLIIVGVDAYEVAKSFTNYLINIVEFNKGIFGNDPNHPRRVCFTTVGLVDYLQQKAGLKILKKRVNLFTYTIEATR